MSSINLGSVLIFASCVLKRPLVRPTDAQGEHQQQIMLATTIVLRYYFVVVTVEAAATTTTAEAAGAPTTAAVQVKPTLHATTWNKWLPRAVRPRIAHPNNSQTPLLLSAGSALVLSRF